MQIESYSLDGKKVNLKKLIADKIGPVHSECIHAATIITQVASSVVREEIYHGYRATILVHEKYLTFYGEDVSRAKRGLEAVLGHSLTPFTPQPKNHPHSQHHK